MNGGAYDPLHDDAQAMALVKRFKLKSSFNAYGNWWSVQAYDAEGKRTGMEADPDLNRAICKCVAQLQAGSR